MAKCHRSNVDSLVLDHRPHAKNTTADNFCISASSIRRIIFDAVSCGGTSRHRHRHRVELHNDKEEKHEKLLDLLNIPVHATDAESKKKEEMLLEVKRVVKELREEDSTKRRMAAARVRLLTKDDAEARGAVAMLGAISPLVGMLDSEDVYSQIDSLYALLNIGIGNDANKAAIVKVGAVHKMLKLIESPGAVVNSSVSEAIVANFLGLSALDSNKPIIGSSGAIPFLVRTLQNLDKSSKSSSQVKQDALRALYNLSINQANISFVLETDLVLFMINSIEDMEVSERVLSILSNLVSTPEGRKAISAVKDGITVLVDVLSWTDSPKCQEKASYILMIMAHKGYADRQTMIEAGIVSALLELTLVGTALAQKRASRILECFRVEKGKQVSGRCDGGNLSLTVSAPIYASSSSTDGGGKEYLMEEVNMMSDEKKAVKQLVQQSLQNNMMKIVKRANLRHDFVPSERFTSLTSSSTSKSLPF
ncbi:U-box domain-containing protein 15-like [Vicia villosa]|uniref:U-box domain-containing protein 15-like n=1 Tax=Vicia villosa TaxID=3911 RepID=UPI00273C5598|nr:U-box domain-containing protein 15-like [Vicia villosa]